MDVGGETEQLRLNGGSSLIPHMHRAGCPQSVHAPRQQRAHTVTINHATTHSYEYTPQGELSTERAHAEASENTHSDTQYRNTTTHYYAYRYVYAQGELSTERARAEATENTHSNTQSCNHTFL